MIHSWEPTDVERQLYTLICTILYRGFEHPGIFGVHGWGGPYPGTSPPQVLGEKF